MFSASLPCSNIFLPVSSETVRQSTACLCSAAPLLQCDGARSFTQRIQQWEIEMTYRTSSDTDTTVSFFLILLWFYTFCLSFPYISFSFPSSDFFLMTTQTKYSWKWISTLFFYLTLICCGVKPTFILLLQNRRWEHSHTTLLVREHDSLLLMLIRPKGAQWSIWGESVAERREEERKSLRMRTWQCVGQKCMFSSAWMSMDKT